MATPQPVLHIGLPKTANNTIKNTIYKNHPEILYIDNDEAGPKEARKKLFEELTAYPSDMSVPRLDGNHFYRKLILKDYSERVYDKEFIANYYRKYIQPTLKDKVFVFSKESCSVGSLNHRQETAERLYSFCPDAKILIVLKNPYNTLKSRYIQMHNGVGSKIDSLPDFAGWLQAHYSVRDHHQSLFQDITYGSLAQIYASLFGQENVHILLLEQMSENQKEYGRKLSTILGVDSDIAISLLGDAHINKRMSKGDFFMKRMHRDTLLFNVFMSKPLRLFSKIFIKGKIDISYPPEFAEKIKKICTEDYKVLVKKWHLPLEQYGYFGN